MHLRTDTARRSPRTKCVQFSWAHTSSFPVITLSFLFLQLLSVSLSLPLQVRTAVRRGLLSVSAEMACATRPSWLGLMRWQPHAGTSCARTPWWSWRCRLLCVCLSLCGHHWASSIISVRFGISMLRHGCVVCCWMNHRSLSYPVYDSLKVWTDQMEQMKVQPYYSTVSYRKLL